MAVHTAFHDDFINKNEKQLHSQEQNLKTIHGELDGKLISTDLLCMHNGS